MIDVNTFRKYFAQGISAARPEFKTVCVKYIIRLQRKLKCAFIK